MYYALKKLLVPFVVSLICVGVIFILHYFFPSLINNYNHPPLHLSGEFMQRIWNRHITHPAFAGRPLTSLAIQAIHYFFNFNYSLSFVLINFSLLIICGILVYKVAQAFSIHHREALWSIVLFYTSLTILFAFFSSIDSYDEPMQYVFLLSSLLLFKKEKWIWGSLTLFLSLIARETSVLLFPALFLIFIKAPSLLSLFQIKYLKKISILLIPLTLYLIVTPLILYNKNLIQKSEAYLMQERAAHWQFNFQNERFSLESLISLISTLILPLYIIFELLRTHLLNKDEQKLCIAFLITCCLNTFIVLITARARESRLFALPLILWWPFFEKYLQMLLKQLLIKNYFSIFKNQLLLASSLLIFFIALLPIYYIISLRIYHPTSSGGFALGYQLYFFTLLASISCYSYLKLHQQVNYSA